MSVTLSPELEALVQKKVQTGQYSSPDEVMLEAMQLLDARDRLARLRRAIAVADEQIERGEGIELTADVWNEIDREVDTAIIRGEMPDPDVCP